MNSLDFLPFYIQLSVVFALGALAYRVIRRGRAGAPPPLSTDDPYRLAYLRDGRTGLLHVAVVALYNRGLVGVDADKLTATRRGEELPTGTSPIEHEVWRRLAKPATVKEIIASRTGSEACDRYQRELEAEGLIPSSRAETKDARVGMVVAGALAAVAAVKVVAGLVHGERNLLSFGVLGVLIPIGVLGIFQWRQTARGKKAVRNIRRELRRMRAARRRLQLGAADVAVFAAVFGPGLLPDAFAHVRDLVAPKGEGGGDGGESGIDAGDGGH